MPEEKKITLEKLDAIVRKCQSSKDVEDEFSKLEPLSITEPVQITPAGGRWKY